MIDYERNKWFESTRRARKGREKIDEKLEIELRREWKRDKEDLFRVIFWNRRHNSPLCTAKKKKNMKEAKKRKQQRIPRNAEQNIEREAKHWIDQEKYYNTRTLSSAFLWFVLFRLFRSTVVSHKYLTSFDVCVVDYVTVFVAFSWCDSTLNTWFIIISLFNRIKIGRWQFMKPFFFFFVRSSFEFHTFFVCGFFIFYAWRFFFFCYRWTTRKMIRRIWWMHSTLPNKSIWKWCIFIDNKQRLPYRIRYFSCHRSAFNSFEQEYVRCEKWIRFFLSFSIYFIWFSFLNSQANVIRNGTEHMCTLPNKWKVRVKTTNHFLINFIEHLNRFKWIQEKKKRKEREKKKQTEAIEVQLSRMNRIIMRKKKINIILQF